MSGRFKCACTGGTYGPFHIGHEKVFEKAFSLADYLFIRLTTDRYLDSYAKKRMRERIPNYDERYEKVYRRLDPLYHDRFKIWPLDEKEDCVNCRFRYRTQAIIVGEDSFNKALALNIRRRESGLYEVEILRVSSVFDYRGSRICSTNMRSGEINEEGVPLTA